MKKMMRKKRKLVSNKLQKVKNQKIIYLGIYMIVLVVAFSFIYQVQAASDPTLVNKLNSALKKIQGYLVKLATPAAGVAIATGVMMRKLSFGNEEKMVMGKKVIVNAIVCYGIIISINLILKFVDAVIG